MAIAHINTRTFTATGTSANITCPVPSSISVGDLLISCYSNVGNYRQIDNTDPSMNSGWVIIEQVTVTTNCYFLVVGKTATSTEVTAAGTNITIGTLPDTTGTSVRTGACSAYSGALAMASQPDDSNLTHDDTAPAGGDIATGAATNNDGSNWSVALYNSAKGSAGSATWTSTGSLTSRGQVQSGGATVSTSAIFDSAGPITTGSKNYTGTWNATPSRLNGAIVILEATPPSDSDSGSGANSESIVVSTSNSDTGSGSEAEGINVPTVDSDSGSGLETDEDLVITDFLETDDSDSGSGTETDEDIFVNVDSFSESDSGSGIEDSENIFVNELHFGDADTSSGSESENVVITQNYLAFDNFDRDDETSLGTASSGHVWTAA